jgi:hypothetical protein
MSTKNVHSFFRPSSFSLVLRGRKVILGEVGDLCDGDLKISGQKQHGYLQVAMLREGRPTPLGGLWGRKRHALPYEVAQRLLDTLQTLRADEYFVMLAGLLAAEAHTREPAQQVVELVKRAVAAVPRAFATRSGRSGVSAEEKRMLLLRAQPIQGETALAA